VNQDDAPLTINASNEALVVFIIRIICLGLLGYWSLILIQPFFVIIVWSIIIAVAVYPIFEALSAKFHGHYKLEHVSAQLNQGILMGLRMGESIGIDSLLGGRRCRRPILRTCVSA